MKDGLLLLLAALCCAAIAWVFWHFLGANGFNVLILVALGIVAADNLRLRRKNKTHPR